MTLDEFKTIYAENPSADEVMEEINRLYESERTLTESFATADSERNRLQKELDDANFDFNNFMQTVLGTSFRINVSQEMLS